jgi:hypothetical protein
MSPSAARPGRAVSILARPSRAGRPRRPVETRQEPVVSILARPSRAGRPLGDPARPWVRMGFNPRSALAGRASCGKLARRQDVSQCFNPRSALAGRASWTLAVYAVIIVSILARPSRAGRLAALKASRGGDRVSILARPSRAGRHVLPKSLQKLSVVSILARPSRAGRRRQHLMAHVSILARPSRAGRPQLEGKVRVSILARPLGSGIACFNPRSALAGRASERIVRSAGHRARFQSSLGPRGPGVQTRCRTAAETRFNPRSALAGRASCNRQTTTAPNSCFNPRSALAGRASTQARSSNGLMFQSSLGPRGPSVAWFAAFTPFQSSLGPRGPGVCQRQVFVFQSSLGPRGPGVMPCCIHPAASRLARPSRAGRLARRFQSILARPSRAGRPRSATRFCRHSTFQSSLGPRGPGVQVRQPRSALAGRASWDPHGPVGCSFNPRSALAGRASTVARFQSSLGPRGPRRPLLGPRGPGVRSIPLAVPALRSFNPRSASRAGRHTRGAVRPLACFNPRSALAGRASTGVVRGFAGRASNSAHITSMEQFQSSLGPRGPGVKCRTPAL